MKYSFHSEFPLSDRKVLVVEDHPDTMEIILRVLQFNAAEVVTAVDGLEGIQKAIQYQPDFIITDLKMPIMNGWAMIKELKANPATSKIPVIAITGYPAPDDTYRAIAAGFHYYMQKPVRVRSFVPEIIHALNADN